MSSYGEPNYSDIIQFFILTSILLETSSLYNIHSMNDARKEL